MRELYEAVPSLTNIWKRHDRNENRCLIRHIATVLRRYQFCPSRQKFTALATDKTTETAPEVAYFMESDQDYVRLAAYRGAGAYAQSIFSTTGQSRQTLLQFTAFQTSLFYCQVTLSRNGYKLCAMIYDYQIFFC